MLAGTDRAGNLVGCLRVPRFPLACELAERPELWGRPVAVAHPEASRAWSVSPAAAALGVAEGQRLSEARGRCPALAVLDARLARYDAEADRVLDALDAVAPVVEPAEPGTAYVELAGLLRYHRSEAHLHRALLACVPRALRPRLGVGPTKFVARLAASRARAGAVHAVPSVDVAGFLALVPVDELPVEPEVVRRLRLVGITTIGELAAVPRHALVAQFGAEGTRVGALLDGAAEPVRPPVREERLDERLAVAEPLTSQEALVAAAAQVLHRVLHHPRRQGRLARQVTVRAETDRGGRWESTVTLRHPKGDRDGVWVALAPVLERAQLPGPVHELSIELHGLCPPRGWQAELWAEPAQAASAERWERVEDGLRQLRARYGRCPVGRIVAVEPWSRLPERRWALVEVE